MFTGALALHNALLLALQYCSVNGNGHVACDIDNSSNSRLEWFFPGRPDDDVVYSFRTVEVTGNRTEILFSVKWKKTKDGPILSLKESRIDV